MKQIPMREGERYKSKEVLQKVAEMAAPNQSISPGQMKQRIKIMDALDKANGSLLLEDADHAALKSAVEQFPWGIAHPELYEIIEDVTEAKEPPANAD